MEYKSNTPFFKDEIFLEPEHLTALSDAAAEGLLALDANEDGSLIFEEVRGFTLATPDGASSLVIAEREDWNVYVTLFQSQINARDYARFAISSSRAHVVTAQTWLAEDPSLIEAPILKTAFKLGGDPELPLNELCDVREMSGDYYLLMHYRGRDEDENCFYTVRLPKDGGDPESHCGMSVEFAGRNIGLRRAMASNSEQEWRFALDVAGDLASLLSSAIPGVPDALRKEHADHLETMLLQEGYLEELNKGSQLDNSEYDLRPVKDLTARENTNLEIIKASVPQTLYDVIAKNHASELEFAVLNDKDITAYLNNAAVMGFYDPESHMIYLRRSALESPRILKYVLRHELSHAAYIPGMDIESVVKSYLDIAKRHAAMGKDSAAPCLYSYANENDFFAECSISYLNGEPDPDGDESRLHGEHSRAELRAENPEMYVLMKLFYEDGMYKGNTKLFHGKSEYILATLFSDPETRALLLAPDTDISVITEKFNEVLKREY